MDYPILTTKRLRLRGWQLSDLDDYSRLNANAQFMTYFGDGQPIGREESFRIMSMMAGWWALQGFGLWLVEDKETGAFIGRVGLLYPEGWPALELGWGIHPDYWGKGYATEAADAAADWAFQNLDCDALISIIDPRNEPSKAVAKRLGESFDHIEFVKDRDCDIFKMSKTDFYSNKQ